MMVRLSVSKREKGRRKRANIMSSQLHSLTHFSDISALTGGTPHLDEVRLWSSGGRWPSCFQLNVYGAYYHEELGQVHCHLEGCCHSFISPCVFRIRILLRSGRRYLRKVGRRKVSQWLGWSSAGWGLRTGMPALDLPSWVLPSPMVSLPYWALISLEVGLYFFLCQAENQHHSQKRFLDSIS